MKQRSWFARLYLFFALVFLPAIGLYEGLVYFAGSRKNIEISHAAQEMVKIRNDLILHADESRFLVNRMNRMLMSATGPQDFADALRKFIVQNKLKIEFAVYSIHGNLAADNFINKTETRAKWAEAGVFLRTVLFAGNSQARFSAIDSLRPLLGRNFFVPEGKTNDSYVAGSFYQTDFNQDRFRCWVAGNEKCLVAARVSPEELLRKTGLRSFAASFTHGRIKFESFSTAHNSHVGSPENSLFARVAYSRLVENPGLEFVTIDNRLFSRVRIDDEKWVLIIYQLDSGGSRYGYIVVSGVLLLLFLLIWLHRTGFLQGGLENLPLLIQICFLMAFSAGIPLVILGSVAVDYFNNKKTALMRSQNQQMVSFAQQIDRSIQIEHARCTRLIRESAGSLADSLARNEPSEKIVGLFKEKLKPVFINAHIIQTEILETEKNQGISGRKKAIYRDFASDMHPGDREIINVLGAQHLAALNSTIPDEPPVDKLYLLEAIFQRPMDMIVRDLLTAEGRMTEAGWGMRKISVFALAVNVLTNNYFDHYVFISILSSVLQEHYVTRNLHDAIRNHWGFTFFAARDRFFLNEQKSLDHFPEISQLFARVSAYPLPEPEIVDYQKEKHLFVGLKGHLAEDMKFCVLYPVSRIDHAITEEAGELLYPAVLGLAIVMFMVLILYLNLLLPVNRLHEAAQALDNRDASFRLPEGSGDEFSDMARIFNASIAEFEELQIASIVQKRLYPSRPLQVKGFSIFGKCMPMVELGGDYFDYFPIDDENFVLMLGDVAGHGVGASLLMAMAKAGVICGRDVYKDPASVLCRLHQIIFSIKNKVQRKVMTFQYLLVNSSNLSLLYANAGGCSPAIVDPESGCVEELRHNGPVLGGFRKTAYSNMELKIRSGQAIILYTDGMVESRNETGCELGYQGLFQLFATCYDLDAAVYYRKIMTAYENWLGNASAGDDMTLIVMVCA